MKEGKSFFLKNVFYKENKKRIEIAITITIPFKFQGKA